MQHSRRQERRRYQLLLCGVLFGASTGQYAIETVIVFMAGVFVKQPGFGPGDGGGPWLSPSGRVADGEAVVDAVVGDARPALHQAYVFCGSLEAHLAAEVGGFDDQRVALPMAAGIAEPLANSAIEMWPPVERYDARLVNLLLRDGHVTRGLDNLVVIVVAGGNARQGCADNAARVEFDV